MDNNSAVSFCGGLYLGYSGYAAHTSTIDRTLFIRNRCAGPSGGLQLGFLEGADNGFTVRLKLLNSVFQENRAEYGGAIHLFANRESRFNCYFSIIRFIANQFPLGFILVLQFHTCMHVYTI